MIQLTKAAAAAATKTKKTKLCDNAELFHFLHKREI
jgi:hypothetical protein